MSFQHDLANSSVKEMGRDVEAGTSLGTTREHGRSACNALQEALSSDSPWRYRQVRKDRMQNSTFNVRKAAFPGPCWHVSNTAVDILYLRDLSREAFKPCRAREGNKGSVSVTVA